MVVIGDELPILMFYVYIVIGFGIAWIGIKAVGMMSRRFGFSAERLTFIANVATLVAWWYRWSLKSTSLIWSLFIWRAWPAFEPRRKAQMRLVYIRDSVLSKVTLAYGILIALVIALKYAAMLLWHDLLASASQHWHRVAIHVAQPLQISVWQLSAVASTLVSVGLFIYADRELLRRKENRGLNDRRVNRVISIAAIIQGVLGAYSSIVLLIILYRVVLEMEPFPIELRWLP